MASCTGLRAFLPVLEVALVSRFGLAGKFQVPASMVWIESDYFLVPVGLLAVVEIVADKVPSVGRAVELPLVFLRPLAGVTACFAVLDLPTPTMNVLAAMAVGLLFSQPILRLKAGWLMVRWQVSRTFVHPGLSLAEDVLAGVAPLLAFKSPVSVFLALVALAFWLLTRIRLGLYRQSLGEEGTDPAEKPPPQTGYGPRPPATGPRIPR